MMANSSFFFNRPTFRINTTAKPLEVEICPGVPNYRFVHLDSSLPHFVNAALNLPLAITTTFANFVILLAIRHVTSIRLPSKLLLCSLVLTDLGVGLVVQPQNVAFLYEKATHPDYVQCALFKSLSFTRSVFSFASLLTLMVISLDRYAALFFHLEYQQIVTTRRVCAVLAFIWSLSFSVASAPFWNFELWRFLAGSVTLVSFPVISVACIRMYRRLRDQHVQPQATDQAQQQAGNTLNMERYRRTASAVMLVYVLFLACCVPYMCSGLVLAAIGYTTLTVYLREIAYTLMLLNSFLNPFVYCLRLPEIRIEAMKQLRKLCCRSSQQ